VTGQIFFAAAESFAETFDLREAAERVVIDVSGTHIWDLTAVAALARVVLKFRREGTEVEIIGMNKAGATLVDRLATHDKPGVSNSPALH
jgi:SulP family sulfate permease